MIFGDPNQLEQIILNLVSNALDALKDGGKITIMLQKDSNEKIKLIVKDNGIGIELKLLIKYFRLFILIKKQTKELD